MIWVVGGTAESREIVSGLIRRGVGFIVTTATPLGRDLYKQCGEDINILNKAMDKDEMIQFIADNRITTVIDMSHPYAVNVSSNAEGASAAAGIKYYRYERPGIEPVCTNGKFFKTYEAAAEYLAGVSGNILLTIGTRNLSAFSGVGMERLFAKVLPDAASLNGALDAGLPPDNIVAARGVVGSGFLCGIVNEFGIKYIVTKDTGESGGFDKKSEAAMLSGITLVVIERPASVKPDFRTLDEVYGVIDGKKL